MLLRRWIKPETSWNLSLTSFFLSCFFPALAGHLKPTPPSRVTRRRTKVKREQWGTPLHKLCGTRLMTTPFPASLQRKSNTRTRSLQVKNHVGRARCTRVDVNCSEGPDIKHALLLCPPLPDAPSEPEQTSCVELIPGLQASAASSSSQESGASPLPHSTPSNYPKQSSPSTPRALRHQKEKDFRIC